MYSIEADQVSTAGSEAQSGRASAVGNEKNRLHVKCGVCGVCRVFADVCDKKEKGQVRRKVRPLLAQAPSYSGIGGSKPCAKLSRTVLQDSHEIPEDWDRLH